MDEVRRAIYSRLSGDAALTALLSAATAIYHGVAPQTAGFPLVVFSEQAGVPVWQFQGGHYENDVWLVKAISRGSSAGAAEDIAKRIGALLTDAPLAITGEVLLGVWREGKVAYSETESGETYWHAGHLIRLISQPA